MTVVKERISFRDIKGMTYNPTLGKLIVFSEWSEITDFTTCMHSIGFKLDEDSATEVTAALKSLGACTSQDHIAC